MKNKNKVIHHNSHKLNSIRTKIENRGYDQLSEKDIEFLSQEIESNKITQLEVEGWMKSKK